MSDVVQSLSMSDQQEYWRHSFDLSLWCESVVLENISSGWESLVEELYRSWYEKRNLCELGKEKRDNKQWTSKRQLWCGWTVKPISLKVTKTKEIALQIIARFPMTRSSCQVIVRSSVQRKAPISFPKPQLQLKDHLSKPNVRNVAEGCYRNSEI